MGSAVRAAVACSVDAVVDGAVGAAVDTIVNDMQANTDGAKADLLKQIHELRAAEGLTSCIGKLDLFDRTPRGGAETGPEAPLVYDYTGTGLGATTPYIPPPARAIRRFTTPEFVLL